MSHYIIHIGLPKTGTKYLQKSLSQVREKLIENDICYPNELWTDRSHFSHFKIVEKIKSQANDDLIPFFDGLNASKIGTIILSCEGFVGLNLDEVKTLRNLLGQSTAEIVFHTRRWSDWLPSAWQQGVRQGDRNTFPEFVYNLIRNPENEQAINHALILDRFGHVFGKGNIKIISYSNVMDARKDIFENFVEVILRTAVPQSTPPKLVNESIDVFHTELVRILNGLDFGPNRNSFLVDRAFSNIMRDPAIKQDLDHVLQVMKDNQKKLLLSDNALALKVIYDQIMNNYQANIVGIGGGQRLFDRKNREVYYISADYLLSEGVRDSIHRIHEAARTFFAPKMLDTHA